MPSAPGTREPGPYAYSERAPAAALTGPASSAWIQHVPAGGPAVVQRHLPHGGGELRCVLGSAPRLLGPATGPRVELLPPGTTVVGVRLRPGALGHLAGLPASELVDQDVAPAEMWADVGRRLEDGVNGAGSPDAALTCLQEHLASRMRAAGTGDALVREVVRRLMPWEGAGGVRALATELSISERQLRRRCRAAVGVGAKELHRMLRFQGFLALVQRTRSAGAAAVDVDGARWATEAGYADQAHLGRECRRLTGLTPRQFLAETDDVCGCGHDHATSYVPLLGPRQARRAG
jgi:AraC-like DNA-binding protein